MTEVLVGGVLQLAAINPTSGRMRRVWDEKFMRK
jgi:hypothetical protein